MYTTDTCDALGDQAHPLPPIYLHFGKRKAFSGIAVTVKCFEDSSRVKELITQPGAGKVLVIDGGGSTRCALWGDESGLTAQQNGWEGAIIHGGIRDAARNATQDIGLMALAAVPRKSNRQNTGATGITVDLGGTHCSAGDYVIADEDGAIIIPAAAIPLLGLDARQG